MKTRCETGKYWQEIEIYTLDQMQYSVKYITVRNLLREIQTERERERDNLPRLFLKMRAKYC
ncbi:hypothetical protein BpHYR1_045408 [Brachionus plicatilis]|uniref:Uncharacterized protein n=1 Tax=Brachionus plicatilis TaxID=10195 RepID=A0A3M7SL55_BRAPC|nr:hypothetical protein BpHYR1_045408 [Brachionus plicatilis]